MTPEGFRRAMRRWATGVAVVTFVDGGAVRGITVNSFTSVSLDPPLVLVCIGKRARVHDALLAARRFCVSILSREQSAIADQFAGRGPAVAVSFDVTRTATPLIAGCVAHLDCVPAACHDGGDHTILVGRPELAETHGDGAPLLYLDRAYLALPELGVVA